MEENFKYSWDEGSSLIRVEHMPNILKDRSRLKSHIFVRRCYVDLYDEANSEEGRQCLGTLVPFVGTAGIGKSVFMMYWIIRMVLDVGLAKVRFYYQNAPGQVYLVEGTDCDTMLFRKFAVDSTILDKSLLLFADLSSQTVLPIDHSGITYVFSSFQESRYKEKIKETSWRVLPTWDFHELSLYFQCPIFWSDNELDRLTHGSMVADAVSLYGGSIRNIVVSVSLFIKVEFDSLDSLLKIAMLEKGGKLAEQIFVSGFAAADAIISDVLVHRNPPIHPVTGTHIYGSRLLMYTPASVHVAKSLFRNLEFQKVAKSKIKFITQTYAGSQDGCLFEFLVLHHREGISGKLFNLKPLSGLNLKDIDISIPPLEMLKLDWKAATTPLVPNMLYAPPTGFMESGDAFCLLLLNDLYVLFVFQVTIAETHAVKMHGLRVIQDCFSDIVINNQVLVFVTPAGGKLVNRQSLTTTSGEDVRRINTNVKGFYDHQYKMEVELR